MAFYVTHMRSLLGSHALQYCSDQTAMLTQRCLTKAKHTLVPAIKPMRFHIAHLRYLLRFPCTALTKLPCTSTVMQKHNAADCGTCKYIYTLYTYKTCSGFHALQHCADQNVLWLSTVMQKQTTAEEIKEALMD